MIVYRLSKKRYARDLSGRGAEKAGGRWNNKGIPIIYTSESRALCTVEIAVHTPLGLIPKDYCLITIEIPETPCLTVREKQLPENWNVFPYPDSTRTIGDEFYKQQETLILQVPSAVVDDDHNFLINPQHPDISKVKIADVSPFNFDRRLFT